MACRPDEALAAAREALTIAVERLKARGDTENYIVAPGLWFGAGWLRNTLLKELTPKETPDGEQQAGSRDALSDVAVDLPAEGITATGAGVGTSDTATGELTPDAALLALKDYAGTLKSARKWLHDSSLWASEDSWEPGRSVDGLLNEKFAAIEASFRASLDREREMGARFTDATRQWEKDEAEYLAALATPTCPHCDLPMTCASRDAERIHGLELMHAETLTRAEQAERRADALAAELQTATEYIGVLESCQDGYYRADTTKEAKAWAELQRLKEGK